MANRSKKPSSSRGVSSIWSFKPSSQWAPIVALGVFLSACGFTPIHKFDASAPALRFAELDVGGDTIARGLRRALLQSMEVNAEAAFSIGIEISRNRREVQKTSSGEALRLELRHEAVVHIRNGRNITRRRFALTQFMTRGDSGADELNQIRALDDLAVRDLSGQILDYLSALDRGEAAQ